MATIYISIGSNIDRQQHLRAGITALSQHFSQLELSSVYESEAVGFDGNPFYNLVASAHTDKDIAEVVACLKQIEQDNGRTPGSKKFAARTLDLDLLLYDQQVCQQPVTLPREEILYNAFVLLPLAELAGQQVHPVAGKTYHQLWHEYDKKQQKLWPVAFSWA